MEQFDHIEDLIGETMVGGFASSVPTPRAIGDAGRRSSDRIDTSTSRSTR